MKQSILMVLTILSLCIASYSKVEAQQYILDLDISKEFSEIKIGNIEVKKFEPLNDSISMAGVYILFKEEPVTVEIPIGEKELYVKGNFIYFSEYPYKMEVLTGEIKLIKVFKGVIEITLKENSRLALWPEIIMSKDIEEISIVKSQNCYNCYKILIL